MFVLGVYVFEGVVLFCVGVVGCIVCCWSIVGGDREV